MNEPEATLHNVVVVPGRSVRRHDNDNTMNKKQKLNESREFVYVNPAFVGSVNSVNQRLPPQEPPTSVIREQYWACSRWPFTQKVLAAAVGLLLGTVLGLTLTVVLRDADIPTIFSSSVPD